MGMYSKIKALKMRFSDNKVRLILLLTFFQNFMTLACLSKILEFCNWHFYPQNIIQKSANVIITGLGWGGKTQNLII